MPLWIDKIIYQNSTHSPVHSEIYFYGYWVASRIFLLFCLFAFDKYSLSKTDDSFENWNISYNANGRKLLQVNIALWEYKIYLIPLNRKGLKCRYLNNYKVLRYKMQRKDKDYSGKSRRKTIQDSPYRSSPADSVFSRLFVRGGRGSNLIYSTSLPTQFPKALFWEFSCVVLLIHMSPKTGKGPRSLSEKITPKLPRQGSGTRPTRG